MKLKIIRLSLAALVVIVVTVSALIFIGTLPNPLIRLALNDPEHSARYYPKNTKAYGWVTFYPEDGQREQMMEMWERFNEFQAIEDVIERLKEEAAEEGIEEFEQEILPWIGADASLGNFHLGDDNGSDNGEALLFTIAVRDSGKAKDYLDDWSDSQNEDEGTNYDYDRIDGYHTWVDEGEQSVVLANGMIFYLTGGNQELALKQLMVLVAGKEDWTLESNELFQAARDSLPERRFASVFVNIEESKAPQGMFPLYEPYFGGLEEAPFNPDIPAWAAVSAQFIDRGIVLDAVVPNEEGYASSLPNLDKPGEAVAADTVGILSATFEPDVDAWRDQLRNYDLDADDWGFSTEEIYGFMYMELESQEVGRIENPDSVDVLDLGLVLFEEYSGVHLERDILDLLGGTAIVGVSAFDWARLYQDPESETINAVGMLSYTSGNGDALGDSLESLIDFATDEMYMELDFESVDVGGDRNAEILSAESPYIQTSYEPGYVLHDGYLIIGSTISALKDAVAAHSGSIDSLASKKEYQRAMDALPDERQVIAWVDIKALLTEQNTEFYDLDDDEYEVATETVGSLGLSFKADESHFRSSMVITLFPE